MSFRNVWKRYGEVIAASNISLDVQSGELLSFLGPSGCGKTTTLRIIAGFDQPSEGDIFLKGSLLWQDCLCIPRTTSNSSGAHTLINYALDAKVSAAIAENLWYATPNQAALELLPDAYREDHVIFPGMDIIERFESALNLGEAGTRLRDRIWKKVSEA